MTRLWGLVVVCLAGSAAHGAQSRAPGAPQAYVPRFLASVSMSLETQPFYASKVLGSLDLHIREVVAKPEGAAGYLKGKVAGEGNSALSVSRVNAGLGKKPLSESQASALILANAILRPDQFQEVVNGLETMRPGLGKRVTESLRKAGEAPGAKVQAAAALRGAGERTRPRPEGALYNSKGELDGLFDGTVGVPILEL